MTSATSPVRRMGLGLVGAGRFATFVATSLESLPQVEVRAVADGQAESARLLADRYDARAARGMEQLLADPGVDIVVIATPPADHAALTVAAISAEKHVFCEKPLALDGETAHHVVELTEHSGCTLVVDHVLRYNPIIAAVGRMQGVD
ncbi:MAG: Gfo/Idh/MocA family protein, partial [Nocardioidaceae bacterium]